MSVYFGLLLTQNYCMTIETIVSIEKRDIKERFFQMYLFVLHGQNNNINKPCTYWHIVHLLCFVCIVIFPEHSELWLLQSGGLRHSFIHIMS